MKSLGSKFLLCASLFLSFCVHAQETETGILASWLALGAPTGHEHLAMVPIQQRYAGWRRDRYGNLIKEIGSGEPRRIVACGLDSYAYAVSQITDAGYLRLHRIGSGSRHPLWDQAHEGQQLRILTRGGPLLGVSAIANGHFASQHRGETAIVTQDDLWLDVGAESADEVAAIVEAVNPDAELPPWLPAPVRAEVLNGVVSMDRRNALSYVLKDGVYANGSILSSRFHRRRKAGVMGSLE